MMASLEEGTDGVRFSIPTSRMSSKKISQDDVVDVGYCSPNLVNVCEDLHDDEVDPGMEGDDETEKIVRKKRKDQGWCRIIKSCFGLRFTQRYEEGKDGGEKS